MPLTEFIKYSITIVLTFLSILLIAQVNIQPTTNNSSVKWTTYSKSKSIVIEYSFQEDNPNRGYNSEFLVFKVSNLSNVNKYVSWDFSAIYENGNCLNCNSDNKELHFESEISKNSYKVGNINYYYKGPLVVFHHFKDDAYTNKKIVKWKKFQLNNLLIK